ncbi:MAG: methyltransferase domain-containing protein [Bacteroidota bacterium]
MNSDKINFFDAAAEHWNEDIADIDHSSLKRVIELLNFKENEIVLDVGCGTGVLFPYLRNQKVIGMDFSSNMLAHIPQDLLTDNIRLICADAHSIPLADNFVDHVVCFSAFPHFTNAILAVKEMNRVLKGGGTLTIFHLAEPDVINGIHQSVGGPIANDFLINMPNLKKLLSEYFGIQLCVQNPNLFLIQAMK